MAKSKWNTSNIPNQKNKVVITQKANDPLP